MALFDLVEDVVRVRIKSGHSFSSQLVGVLKQINQLKTSQCSFPPMLTSLKAPQVYNLSTVPSLSTQMKGP